MPTISVIVPVYKVEPYLRRCVDSILNQTFSDFELILVDDGSPDNCGAICDEYAAGDKRIKVIHKANGGLSDARNAGLGIARGDYISFVDSDDYIEHNMYEHMYLTAIQYDAQIVQCGVRLVSNDPDVKMLVWETREPGIYNGTDILMDGKIRTHEVVVCNKIYKKELWEGIRFPVGYIHEDEFVIHHVYGRSNMVICIADMLYNYYQSPNSIMRSDYSISQLDLFGAWADRIAYLQEQQITDGLDRPLYFYFDRLRYTYFNRKLNEAAQRRLDEICKRSRKIFQLFMKCNTATMTTKIATFIFLYFPTIYKTIWERS